MSCPFCGADTYFDQESPCANREMWECSTQLYAWGLEQSEECERREESQNQKERLEVLSNGRCLDVIFSCKNLSQLEVAQNYCFLWAKQFPKHEEFLRGYYGGWIEVLKPSLVWIENINLRKKEGGKDK